MSKANKYVSGLHALGKPPSIIIKKTRSFDRNEVPVIAAVVQADGECRITLYEDTLTTKQVLEFATWLKETFE